MVAPDRVMVRHRAAIRDHRIKTGRLDGVPLRGKIAVPSGGVEGEIRRRPVRIDMGAAAGHLAGAWRNAFIRMPYGRERPIARGIINDPFERAIKEAASDALIEAGGTITHHHAVGRDHRPWYDRQRPELFAAAFRAAKRELDPQGMLNPGVLIDP